MSAHGLQIWEAPSASGFPTCISGNTNSTTGLTLTLYRDKGGEIIGGFVEDEDGLVSAFGYIHSGEYLAEVKE